jgi:hypothetical protein
LLQLCTKRRQVHPTPQPRAYRIIFSLKNHIPSNFMSHRSHPPSPNAQHTIVTSASNPNSWSPGPSRPVSRGPTRAPPADSAIASSKHNGYSNGKATASRRDEEDFSAFDEEEDEMGDRRPPLNRPTDGQSHQPLLHKDDEERGRTGYDASFDAPERPPLFSRRSTMRSRSPDTQAKLATRKKYTYAAFFLGLSLVSFVVQTETAVYIQHELGWNKAYCML